MTESLRAAGMLKTLRNDSALWSLYCLQREYRDAPRDVHGRVDYGDVAKDAFVGAPVSAALIQQGWEPTYPDGHSWALCLTHDVDDVQIPLAHSAAWVGYGAMHGQARTIASGFRSCLPGIRRSPYRDFDRIMQLEEKHGAKSTFFFLARSEDYHRRRYDVRDLSTDLRGIVASGWEVGLHVAYEGYLDAANVRDQRHRIEDVSGSAVLGARNHYLRFRTPTSWWVAAESGLRYDCTLGFSDRMGFRNGMCHPFVPYDCERGESVPVLEIPLAIMDASLMAGIHMRFGADVCLNMLRGISDEVARKRGVLMVLWHNDTFAAPWKTELGTLYESLLDYGRDGGAWMTSAAEICTWWTGQTEPSNPGVDDVRGHQSADRDKR